MSQIYTLPYSILVNWVGRRQKGTGGSDHEKPNGLSLPQATVRIATVTTAENGDENASMAEVAAVDRRPQDHNKPKPEDRHGEPAKVSSA